MASKRLKRHVLNCTCGVVTGDRGAGKSSLFAFIVDTFLEAGYEVYCQYPYKNCYQIPMKETTINGVSKMDVDKDWLYSVNLSHCCVLIDEARTVWPARSYAKWTISDDEFFNFLRKNDTHLFLATQAYDALDLNIRRAADETYYMTPGFWHFSHIEASHTTLAKVADRQTEVVGRMFKKGMAKVTYDICEVPSGDFLFWRRPWYNKFISTYTFYEKPVVKPVEWEEVIDFNKLQAEQGYIETYELKQKIIDFFENIRTHSIDEENEEASINDLKTFYSQPIEEEIGQDIKSLKSAVFGKIKSIALKNIDKFKRKPNVIKIKQGDIRFVDYLEEVGEAADAPAHAASERNAK